MGFIQIISLIFTIVRYVPKLFTITPEVVRLLKQMKEENWLGDIKIIFEILKLLLDLAPTDKQLVALNFKELKARMKAKDKDGILGMRDSLRQRKKLFGFQPVEKV